MKKRNHKKIRLLMGRLILVALLFGPRMADASISLDCTGARVLEIRDGQVFVRLDLLVRNSESRFLQVGHGQIDLRVDHHRFGHGHVIPMYFAPGEQRLVHVLVSVPEERFAALIWNVMTEKRILWSARGQVLVNGKNLAVQDSGSEPVAAVIP